MEDEPDIGLAKGVAISFCTYVHLLFHYNLTFFMDCIIYPHIDVGSRFADAS